MLTTGKPAFGKWSILIIPIQIESEDVRLNVARWLHFTLDTTKEQ